MVQLILTKKFISVNHDSEKPEILEFNISLKKDGIESEFLKLKRSYVPEQKEDITSKKTISFYRDIYLSEVVEGIKEIALKYGVDIEEYN